MSCWETQMKALGSRDGNRSGRPAPVTGRVGSTLGDRCVTGRPHKMQKDTFVKYKPKTEIYLL